MSVNYQSQVAAYAATHPTEWANAHTGNAQTEDFIRGLAASLHATDPNVGLNGKRGNPNDISDDALAVFEPTIPAGGRHDPSYDVQDRTGRFMAVIDCIAGAGGPNPSPAWSSVGGPSPGAWVQPDASAPPGPTPTPGAGWEPKHSDLLARFPASSTPNRDTVRRIAEQFAFSFPGEGWGHKSKDANSPASDNVIARQTPGSFVGYVVIPRTTNPPTFNLVGQRFIAVPPTNHLGVPAPGPEPTPQPQPTPGKAYPGDAFFGPASAAVFANYEGRGEAVNRGVVAWIARIIWRVNNQGQTIEQAVATVIAEMPPVPTR